MMLVTSPIRTQWSFLALAAVLFFASKSDASQEGMAPVLAKSQAFCVATFHCLSVYWSPEKGEASKKVLIKFRETGEETWRDGLPLRYNPIKAAECKADYRGSIVNLKPGTAYEITLTLEGTDVCTSLQASTWSEKFPVSSVVKVENRSDTLEVKNSGTPDGYVLYDGTGCVIDCGNKSPVGISVDASYVILRGFTIRNVAEHGIRIFGGKHIVIEDCDNSKWGSEQEKGVGVDCQGAVFSNCKELQSVVIQRCKFHHPSWDSNSWAELNFHGESEARKVDGKVLPRHYHPTGPQCVVFWDSEGNHVIRYNECWSDNDHYFNDGFGAGYNGSYRGFPGSDSDIYCNYIANCWDDGIEAEGNNQNVRIWGNYIENTLMMIANAATSIGPLYVWRNVSGRSYTPPGSAWKMTHGCFLKMGYEQWATGYTYVFNNTIFQPNGEGAGGLGGSSKAIRHCISRNNILHVRPADTHCISTDTKNSANNDFDYDLLSADRYPAEQEKHGIKGAPRYVPDAGFSFETKTGIFHLTPDSAGFDKGEVIPNFCDVFNGAPDIGAHEAGAPRMTFGVKAEFVPPSSRSAR